jgi:hypothetical protein
LEEAGVPAVGGKREAGGRVYVRRCETVREWTMCGSKSKVPNQSFVPERMAKHALGQGGGRKPVAHHRTRKKTKTKKEAMSLLRVPAKE